jgi:hypothetical protein
MTQMQATSKSLSKAEQEQGSNKGMPTMVEHRIAIVAVGNGGGNAAYRSVTHFRKALTVTGIRPELIEFKALNTNPKSLPFLAKKGFETLQLRCITGSGAGSDPRKGRNALFSTMDEVKAMFADRKEIREIGPDKVKTQVIIKIIAVWIIASLRKGTGGGVTEPLAIMLRDELGISVTIQALMPYRHEGISNMEYRQVHNRLQRLHLAGFRVTEVPAEAAFKRVKKLASEVNASSQQPSEQLNQYAIEGMLPDEAYALQDEKVAQSWIGIAAVLLDEGHGEADESDVLTNIFRTGNGGSLSVGFASAVAEAGSISEEALKHMLNEVADFWYCTVARPFTDCFTSQHGLWNTNDVEAFGKALAEFTSQASEDSEQVGNKKGAKLQGEELASVVVAPFIPRPTLGEEKSRAPKIRSISLMIAGPIMSTAESVKEAREQYKQWSGVELTRAPQVEFPEFMEMLASRGGRGSSSSSSSRRGGRSNKGSKEIEGARVIAELNPASLDAVEKVDGADSESGSLGLDTAVDDQNHETEPEPETSTTPAGFAKSGWQEPLEEISEVMTVNAAEEIVRHYYKETSPDKVKVMISAFPEPLTFLANLALQQTEGMEEGNTAARMVLQHEPGPTETALIKWSNVGAQEIMRNFEHLRTLSVLGVVLPVKARQALFRVYQTTSDYDLAKAAAGIEITDSLILTKREQICQAFGRDVVGDAFAKTVQQPVTSTQVITKPKPPANPSKVLDEGTLGESPRRDVDPVSESPGLFSRFWGVTVRRRHPVSKTGAAATS